MMVKDYMTAEDYKRVSNAGVQEVIKSVEYRMSRANKYEMAELAEEVKFLRSLLKEG